MSAAPPHKASLASLPGVKVSTFSPVSYTDFVTLSTYARCSGAIAFHASLPLDKHAERKIVVGGTHRSSTVNPGLRAYIRLKHSKFSWLLDEDVASCDTTLLLQTILTLPETDQLRRSVEAQILPDCAFRIFVDDRHLERWNAPGVALCIELGDAAVSKVVSKHRMVTKFDGYGRKYVHLIIDAGLGTFSNDAVSAEDWNVSIASIIRQFMCIPDTAHSDGSYSNTAGADSISTVRSPATASAPFTTKVSTIVPPASTASSAPHMTNLSDRFPFVGRRREALQLLRGIWDTEEIRQIGPHKQLRCMNEECRGVLIQIPVILGPPATGHSRFLRDGLRELVLDTKAATVDEQAAALATALSTELSLPAQIHEIETTSAMRAIVRALPHRVIHLDRSRPTDTYGTDILLGWLQQWMEPAKADTTRSELALQFQAHTVMFSVGAVMDFILDHGGIQQEEMADGPRAAFVVFHDPEIAARDLFDPLFELSVLHGKRVYVVACGANHCRLLSTVRSVCARPLPISLAPLTTSDLRVLCWKLFSVEATDPPPLLDQLLPWFGGNLRHLGMALEALAIEFGATTIPDLGTKLRTINADDAGLQLYLSKCSSAVYHKAYAAHTSKRVSVTANLIDSLVSHSLCRTQLQPTCILAPGWTVGLAVQHQLAEFYPLPMYYTQNTGTLVISPLLIHFLRVLYSELGVKEPPLSALLASRCKHERMLGTVLLRLRANPTAHGTRITLADLFADLPQCSTARDYFFVPPRSTLRLGKEQCIESADALREFVDHVRDESTKDPSAPVAYLNRVPEASPFGYAFIVLTDYLFVLSETPAPVGVFQTSDFAPTRLEEEAVRSVPPESGTLHLPWIPLNHATIGGVCPRTFAGSFLYRKHTDCKALLPYAPSVGFKATLNEQCVDPFKEFGHPIHEALHDHQPGYRIVQEPREISIAAEISSAAPVSPVTRLPEEEFFHFAYLVSRDTQYTPSLTPIAAHAYVDRTVFISTDWLSQLMIELNDAGSKVLS